MNLYLKLKEQLFLTARQCTYFQALAKVDKFKVDNFKVLYNSDSFQGEPNNGFEPGTRKR